MFARNVTFSVKPNRNREIALRFEKEVLPILRTSHGFTDQITPRTDAPIVKLLSPLYTSHKAAAV